jgi:hypothetical protein
MMNFFSSGTILLIIILLGFDVNAAQRVEYQRGQEIELRMAVGMEHQVVFPEPVLFGKKASYDQLFQYSLIDTVFFVTPLIEQSTRLVFQSPEGERVYVVSVSALSADKIGPVDPRFVVMTEQMVEQHKAKEPESLSPEKAASNKNADYFDLVRYASQTLFAPSLSYVEPVNGVRQVPVENIDPSHLYYGGEFTAKVLASFTRNGRYVTAVKLTNVSSSDRAQLKFGRFRGDFVGVSPQAGHYFAQPLGTHRKDFVVVYLTSDKPFDLALTGGAVL